MKDIKGTLTEKNVLTAFSGESQARNRYTFWASQAEKDGFIFVRNIFIETANQEKAHAKRLFRFLQGGIVEITGGFPAGVPPEFPADPQAQGQDQQQGQPEPSPPQPGPEGQAQG